MPFVSSCPATARNNRSHLAARMIRCARRVIDIEGHARHVIYMSSAMPCSAVSTPETRKEFDFRTP
eukprot:45553-Rhodomonas_salina.1